MKSEIVLTPLTPGLMLQIGSDLSKLGLVLTSDDVGTLVRDIARMQFDMYTRTGTAEPWIGYIASKANDGVVVGSCSFVGPPRDGFIEIAYFTFPHAEGCGFARLMAAELLSIAKLHTPYPKVFAHTLPQYNASTSVLKRLGFEHVGEGIDDEVGRVWRWEAPLSAKNGPGHSE